MANRKAYKETFDEAFKDDCTVINLATEYPGFEGTVKYLILTDLPREELEEKYGNILSGYSPYITWRKTDMLEIKNDFQRNEDKYAKRALRNEESDWDETSQSQGCRFTKAYDEGFEKKMEEDVVVYEQDAAIRMAFLSLPEHQKKRIWLRAGVGFTYEQIGKIEGINGKNAWKSIGAAMESLKKNYEKNIRKIFSEGVKNDGSLSVTYGETDFNKYIEQLSGEYGKGENEES
ncbi:MAG: hypothetical protein IJ106_04575 [Parasporobacterium sp.]|nr:hypothetical protein [Parasporobacterium sp.]